jgi:hypothetical protein
MLRGVRSPDAVRLMTESRRVYDEMSTRLVLKVTDSEHNILVVRAAESGDVEGRKRIGGREGRSH